MSGSRSADQELVFCHACQNEFYKEGDSLTCPECQSDFTEVIDPSFDPRGAGDADPLGGHNPWERDPDEMDIDEVARRQGQGRPQGYMRDDPFRTPTGASFASMVTGMMGRPGPGPGPEPRNRDLPAMYSPSDIYHSAGPSPFHSHPPPRDFGNRWRPMSGLSGEAPQPSGNHIYSRSFGGDGGRSSGFHISFSTNTGGHWRTTTNQGDDFEDVNDMLRQMMGMVGHVAAGGNRGGPPGAQGEHPFAAIFSSILNPANAQSGDAVFSQEAFDRVMSQLMDQHTTGSAPGPASEQAISALPKKKITDDMLDENTHQAECSICMENVAVGEEVTVLPCQHWFHDACVGAWLAEHDTCPVCRSGIMPKEGGQDAPRTPQQAPMNDLASQARRQSGTRDHPYVVAESPTSERRRRRPSGQRSNSESSRRTAEGEGSSSITGRVRSFFGGGSGANSSGPSSKR